MISTLHSFKTCNRLDLRTSTGPARLISRKTVSAQSKLNQYWLMRVSTGHLSLTWEMLSSDVPLQWTLNNNLNRTKIVFHSNLKTKVKPPGSNSLSWSAVSVLILIAEKETFHRSLTLDMAFSAILRQKVWIISPPVPLHFKQRKESSSKESHLKVASTNIQHQLKNQQLKRANTWHIIWKTKLPNHLDKHQKSKSKSLLWSKKTVWEILFQFNCSNLNCKLK